MQGPKLKLGWREGTEIRSSERVGQGVGPSEGWGPMPLSTALGTWKERGSFAPEQLLGPCCVPGPSGELAVKAVRAANDYFQRQGCLDLLRSECTLSSLAGLAGTSPLPFLCWARAKCSSCLSAWEAPSPAFFKAGGSLGG